MTTDIKKETTIDQMCKGLRILEKYKPTSTVYGKNTAKAAILLQEEEFKEIMEDDRLKLFHLGWETNGSYLWWI
ncbi:hypothetical protein BH10PSE19_BH10PSE19_04560 [soil metagenome]